jgi:hypothetical protein
VVLIDSTPLECAPLGGDGEAIGLGWGRRLWSRRHPRAFTLASPTRDEREVGIELLQRANRVGGEILLGDRGYAGRDFAKAIGQMQATIARPARKDEANGLHLAPIRQRVESISWTCRDILILERHGARTLPNLRVRIAQRFLALAACITLNYQLGRPSRSLVHYVA